MKKKTLLLSLFLSCITYIHSQTAETHRFDNQYMEYRSRSDYFNWKVYLVAGPAFLNSISQIVYYLDPTFKKSTRTIDANPKNPNFTLCCNGWGEFQIRIKIVFKDRSKPDLFEKYDLVLTSKAKRNPQYTCGF
jgi:hypothetical protein